MSLASLPQSLATGCGCLPCLLQRPGTKTSSQRLEFSQFPLILGLVLIQGAPYWNLIGYPESDFSVLWLI